jgi:hypothetical protein
VLLIKINLLKRLLKQLTAYKAKDIIINTGTASNALVKTFNPHVGLHDALAMKQVM